MGDQGQPLSRYLHDPNAAQVWVEPTREMMWWTAHAGSVIAPAPGRETVVSRLIAVIAVTPSAHVANMSLQFQAYLYDVFHQTWTSRVFHIVCMPLINMMVLAWLMQFQVAGLDLGTTAAVALAGWYLVQTCANRMLALGVVMAPITIATWAAAAAYHAAFALPPDVATWYAPTALRHNPLLWMAVLSFVQAVSHGPEPALPPRVNGTDRWMTLPQFLFGTRDRRNSPATIAVNLVRSGLQLVFGALDEWWACWRLIPLNVLDVMWRLGYQRTTRDAYKALSTAAIEGGNPAIDFIGTGGGARLRVP